MTRKKIGDLTPGVEQRATYCRTNGRTYCLINSEFHVEVFIEKNGSCIGQGKAEAIDPQEEVEIIHDGVARQPQGPLFRDRHGVAF